nr:hypothetical protein [Tanacetum cinerariifolium]
MWYEEIEEKSKTDVNPPFSLCCQGGKVLLTTFNDTPPPLNSLLDYNHSAASKFRDQIRVYNSMFCFTSFGAKIDHSINTGRAPYTFRISGQSYHRMGSLIPNEGTQPKFAHLYFLILKMRKSMRQYNAPTAAEVTAVIINDLCAVDEQRLKWTRNNQDTLWVELYHNLSFLALLQREGIKVTMFTDWFELNKRDPAARTLTIVEIPKYYVWGVQGFEELMTVNNRICPTFKEAYFAHGLLNDDREWTKAISKERIASLLLPTGRTADSKFVILVDLMKNNTCGIKPNTQLAKLLEEVFTFTRNMRVNEYSTNGALDTSKQEFNRWVLGVGDGNLPAKIKEGEDEPTWIKIPERFLIKECDTPIEQIMAETYPDFTSRQTDEEYLKERAILTLRNEDADAVNEFMFKKLSGEAVTKNNADEICQASTVNIGQHQLYPVEFLNSLNFPGMPPHELCLKKNYQSCSYEMSTQATDSAMKLD